MPSKEEDDVWVKCDLCDKWRKLPPGNVAPPDDTQWYALPRSCVRAVRVASPTADIRRSHGMQSAAAAPPPLAPSLASRRDCSMNPDTTRNSCDVPEEVRVAAH